MNSSKLLDVLCNFVFFSRFDFKDSCPVGKIGKQSLELKLLLLYTLFKSFKVVC